MRIEIDELGKLAIDDDAKNFLSDSDYSKLCVIARKIERHRKQCEADAERRARSIRFFEQLMNQKGEA